MHFFFNVFLCRYDIFNFQQFSNGQFGYARIGEWADGKLTINESSIAWSNGTKDGVTSFCSEPCDKASVKVRVKPNLSQELKTQYVHFRSHAEYFLLP